MKGVPAMPTAGCPPSDFSDPHDDRVHCVVDFWNQARVCDELTATLWRALEPIERQVTECLDKRPPDIGRAEGLTALALRIIAGGSQD